MTETVPPLNIFVLAAEFKFGRVRPCRNEHVPADLDSSCAIPAFGGLRKGTAGRVEASNESIGTGQPDGEMTLMFDSMESS